MAQQAEQLEIDIQQPDRTPKQHIQNLCHLQINGVFDRHSQTLYTAHGAFPTKYKRKSRTAWQSFNNPEVLEGQKRWLVYPKTTPTGEIIGLTLAYCRDIKADQPEVMRLTGVLKSIDLTAGNEHVVFKVYRDTTQLREGDLPYLLFTVSGLLTVGEVPLKRFQVWDLELGIDDGKLVARSAVLLKDAKERSEGKTKGKAKEKPKKKSVEIERKQAA